MQNKIDFVVNGKREICKFTLSKITRIKLTPFSCMYVKTQF